MLLKELQHLRSLADRPGGVIRSAHRVGCQVVGIAVGVGTADGVAGSHDLAAVDDLILFNRSACGCQLWADQPRIRTYSCDVTSIVDLESWQPGGKKTDVAAINRSARDRSLLAWVFQCAKGIRGGVHRSRRDVAAVRAI